MERLADLRPCDRCGYTHPRRMIALMSLWFARDADLPVTGGYFYLCPRCYGRLIEPHAAEIIHRLVEQHPFLHSRTPVRHYQAEVTREPGIGGAQTSPAAVPGVSAPGPTGGAAPPLGQFPLAE